MMRKKDIFKVISTYFSAVFVFIILISMIIYIFSNGISNLSLKFITSDYYEKVYVIKCNSYDKEYTNPNIKDTYFSYKYGVALKDSKSISGEKCIVIAYVAIDSVFNDAMTKQGYSINENDTIDILIGTDEYNNDVNAYSKNGALKFSEALDKTKSISYLQIKTMGGGIRGSLKATFILILFTLLFSLPLGIGAAIYLVLYAKDGKAKTIISSMIDSTSGIPSIIFGFVGMIVFIPIISSITKRNDYSILAGSLTMTIILLPTIVKVTSEALYTVPQEYMENSLALGASKTQTIFKVILPNAIPGILSAVILSIGRIIGESAALIFVMGTFIKDDVSLLNGATSLSLHIYSLTKAEVPNYESACAISIIILIIVFVLSAITKILHIRFNKKRGL